MDLDGDGDADVVTAADVSNQFAWYENDGSTPPVWTLHVIDDNAGGDANGARGINAVDLDGDGDTDVVTAADNSDQFAWYENDGLTPPGWTLRVIDDNAGGDADGARVINAVDLDGDGDTDVVTAAFNSDQFAWYENDGSTPPVWTLRVIDSGATHAASATDIDAVDLDGDGDTDVVTAARNSNQFAWYENDGSTPPVWTRRVIDSGTTNADGAYDIEAVDFDGDGDIDVVTAANRIQSVRLVRERRVNTPVWILHVIDDNAGGDASGAREIDAVDLDGDGDTDVVTAAEDSNQFAWYEMAPHDVRQSAPGTPGVVTSPLIAFADFLGSYTGWGTVTWNQGNIEGRITVAVLDNTGTPTGLSATTTTTGEGSIDISSLATTGATASIRLQATLDDVDGPESGTSPQLTDWTVAPGAPTAVELVSFTAVGLDGAVELIWETGSEMDNLGFHLYRSLSEEGPCERITASLIPGLGSSPAGARYSYRDTGLANGVTYFYELEDIETTGQTKRHGPVSAIPKEGGASDEVEAPVEDEGSESVITYGDPEANHLRVVKRGRYQVVVELTTEGFLAYPEPDGSVRIEIPDYLEVGDSGLPKKRTWVEALAGRQVRARVDTRARCRDHRFAALGLRERNRRLTGRRGAPEAPDSSQGETNELERSRLFGIGSCGERGLSRRGEKGSGRDGAFALGRVPSADPSGQKALRYFIVRQARSERAGGSRRASRSSLTPEGQAECPRRRGGKTGYPSPGSLCGALRGAFREAFSPRALSAAHLRFSRLGRDGGVSPQASAVLVRARRFTL